MSRASLPLQTPKHPFKLTSLLCGQLLQSITNTKSYQKGKELHAQIISSGLLTENTYISTKLSAMYALSGKIGEARVLFDGIVLKNPFLWNAMIRGYACNGFALDSLIMYYACNGFALDSLIMYRQMLRFGIRGDNFSYPFVLMACGDVSLVKIGRKVHCEVIVGGYESDVYVGNSLLFIFLKFGEMGIAQKLFDRMHVRDITSWNTIVSGYVRNGHLEKVLAVFDVAVKGEEKVDYRTLVGVLPACANLSALKQGMEIHAYIVRRNMEYNRFMPLVMFT